MEGNMSQTTNFYTPSEDQTVELQSILERELKESISIEEAQEIGIQLISLYECLARDRKPLLELQNDE